MTKRLLAYVALLTGVTVYGASPLSFTAQVVDSGRLGGDEAFVVVAELRNPTEADVEVTMMTCGWSDSLVAEPSSDFWIVGQECYSNYPTAYVLKPKAGYMFVFPVIYRGSNDRVENVELRVGFSVTTALLVKAGTHPEIIWGTPIKVPKIKDKVITNTYERAPLPNQALLPTTTAVTPAAGQPSRQP